MNPKGIDLVKKIYTSEGLLGIPHKKLDCQAAVEKALSLVGVNVNYRGSNHMWREMVHDRMTIDSCKEQYDGLIPGAIAFHVKNDGKEVERGYHDNYGNAVHVGIVLTDGYVFHSGANGTEIIKMEKSTFNYVALCKHLEYEQQTAFLLVDDDDENSEPYTVGDTPIDAAIFYLELALDYLKKEVKYNG